MLRISVDQLSKSVVLENLLKINGKGDPRQADAFAQAMNRLKRTKEGNPVIAEFMLLDATGKVVVSSDNESTLGLDKSTDAYFLGAQKGTYIKDVYFSETKKVPLMAVSAPILDSQTQEFLGVLAARVRLNDLNNITTNETGMGKSGEIYIVNKYGFMVTPSRFKEDAVLKERVNTKNVRQAWLHKDIKHVLSQDKLADVFSSYRGVQVLGAHEFIPQMQWAVLAEIEQKEVFQPLAKLRLTFLVSLFITSIAAWLSGIFLAKLITGPLHKLHKGTEVIGNGNLDYKVGTDAKDEVGQLSRAFDTMTANLRTSTTSIENLNKEITEREKLETQLWESQERYRAFVDNTILGVAVMDTNYKIITVNPTFAGLFKKPASDFVGKCCFREFEKHEAACAHCPGARAMASGKTEEVETQGVRDDGSSFWVHNRAVPFFDQNGALRGFIEMVEDIDARKKAEEELRGAYEKLKITQSQLMQSAKMASVGLLAGGVAHEINNPLTGVLNNVQLIKMMVAQNKDFNVNEFEELLNIIEESALRCTKITHSLLDFSHASKGLFQETSLNDIVEKVIILIGHELNLQNIIIHNELAPGLPNIWGDPQLLQQVIFDIFYNAKWAIQKKSSKEGGTINVKTEYDTENRRILIYIQDTGMGIPKENLERIFEPFFTTKPTGEGTGLGLSIIYNIIKQHNGSIEVKSEVNQGTTFKINLPAL